MELSTSIIAEEFPNIGVTAYLDHAGATLYSKTQIEGVMKNLQSSLYGNPHSNNPASNFTQDVIETVRCQILKLFNTSTEKYAVIFTSGASAALALLIDIFCFSTNKQEPGRLVYLSESHTSVVGTRGAVNRDYVHVSALPHSDLHVLDRLNLANEPGKTGHASANCLAILTAQCNFSGHKYPMEWIDNVQNGCLNDWDEDGRHMIHETKSKQRSIGRWFCALDAANYAGTNQLDLGSICPDFICLSFYKIFGFPTGLGALLILRESAAVLEKRYFGGGTVNMMLPSCDKQEFRERLEDRLEDGTSSFLSIMAVAEGIKTLQRLAGSMENISKLVFSLAGYFYSALVSMHYDNNQPVAEIYCEGKFESIASQGGIVSFNLLNPDGQYIGYSTVEKIASARDIIVRTGCFCNVGACQRYLSLSNEQIRQHHAAGHQCGDGMDLVDGQPTGAIRVSFGYMSRKRDADQLISMIRECFIQRFHSGSSPHCSPLMKTDTEHSISTSEPLQNFPPATLTHITVYPVKSCSGFNVECWPFSPHGLAFDRCWMITCCGVMMTQKRETRLCLINTRVDMDTGVLTLSADSFPDTEVPFNFAHTGDQACDDGLQEARVCRRNVAVLDCGQAVADWLSNVLGLEEVRLKQYCSITPFQRTDRSHPRITAINEEKQAISLVNNSPFTLVNAVSIESLLPNEHPQVAVTRFRANFVVRAHPAFVEHRKDIASVLIDKYLRFPVSGPVSRCQIICVNQFTAERSREPLIAIKTIAANANKLIPENAFGIRLGLPDELGLAQYVSVGSSVVWETEPKFTGEFKGKQ